MIDASFLDFHSNLPMADDSLRLPTVRHISFLCSARKILTNTLLEKIHHTCPRVHSIHLINAGPPLCLSITLAKIDVLPSFTFQMVTQLKIDHSSTSLPTLRRMFELFPRVEYLVVSHKFVESWRIVQPLCELPKSVRRFTVQLKYDKDRTNIDQWQTWLPFSVELHSYISKN
ncbi:unnamed protein product [Adineta ricciae]|uniref:Uncharacterized protein n=1 Tax=Adineta ricciae TaxID=249248 RepID=A0A816H377_ADIRI|nr:unnamed protein product [Adineta ricciae]